MSNERLDAIRKEKEYFIKRYNEEPFGEYKDWLSSMVILAKAMEQTALDETRSSGEKGE